MVSKADSLLKLTEWKTGAHIKVWKKTNWEKWFSMQLYGEIQSYKMVSQDSIVLVKCARITNR